MSVESTYSIDSIQPLKISESAKKVCIWPVWSDSEIEKQEQGVSGKGRDKAKLSHAPPVS